MSDSEKWVKILKEQIMKKYMQIANRYVVL